MLQNVSHNHVFTMAVLRNRLLLPEAGIAPEIIKGDKDTLRLVKPTGSGSLGGTTALPSPDAGRPARRASCSLPRGREINTFSAIFTTPWRPTVHPPVT